jgi:ribonuclease J
MNPKTKITVYRPNQIGGCITEIESSKGTKIIIDVGSNLPGIKVNEEVDVPELTKNCNGVFITHYHGDHLGEFDKIIY